MIKQVEQICTSPRQNVTGGEEGRSQNSLQEQIYDTFVLRLVSCIQLASKLSLHYNVTYMSLFQLHFQYCRKVYNLSK